MYEARGHILFVDGEPAASFQGPDEARQIARILTAAKELEEECAKFDEMPIRSPDVMTAIWLRVEQLRYAIRVILPAPLPKNVVPIRRES